MLNQLMGGAAFALLATNPASAAVEFETSSFFVKTQNGFDVERETSLQHLADTPNLVGSRDDIFAETRVGSKYVKGSNGFVNLGAGFDSATSFAISKASYILTASHDATVTANLYFDRTVSINDPLDLATRLQATNPNVAFGEEEDRRFVWGLQASVSSNLSFRDLSNDTGAGFTSLGLSTAAYRGIDVAKSIDPETEAASAVFETYAAADDLESVVRSNRIVRNIYDVYDDDMLSRSGNYSLDVNLIAGRQYEVKMSIFCIVDTSFAADLYMGDSAGTSATCDAGRSSYWNGLTNIRDASGNAIADFTLRTEDGTDFVTASALSPAPPGSGGAVPEPATWAMMVIGFAAAGASVRRRQLRFA